MGNPDRMVMERGGGMGEGQAVMTGSGQAVSWVAKSFRSCSGRVFVRRD
jgi:hypothetical protein